ncbi:transposable element Tc1 transposase [Trichonephila clavipes]|nr:transposable element Tc1 transposase [Trichonephila clavipes]
MPLRRRISYYQQLPEFERGRVTGEGGFSFLDIAENLGRNVSTVRDCWEQWSKDGTASRPGSRRSHGTKREDHRIQRTAVVHRNGTTVTTNMFEIGYFDSSEQSTL